MRLFIIMFFNVCAALIAASSDSSYNYELKSSFAEEIPTKRNLSKGIVSMSLDWNGVDALAKATAREHAAAQRFADATTALEDHGRKPVRAHHRSGRESARGATRGTSPTLRT